MNVSEAIYKRKSIRKFKDEIVPREDILKMIELATEAPSPKHQQNWHFIVLQDKDKIDEIAEIVEKSHIRIGEMAKDEKDKKKHMIFLKYYTLFKHAPALVIVYANKYDSIEEKILIENGINEEELENLRASQSCAQGIGAAIENFLLGATEMGYGTCYMTGPTHAKVEIEEYLNFEKEGYNLMSMIALGKPEDNTSEKPKRKPLEEVVTFID